jgi:hypothetical protein
MHKYFARRPWNVISQLVDHYSEPGDLVLDPFCGGGTTVVESLKLGRKAVGVDLNPVATYVTEMECAPVDCGLLGDEFLNVSRSTKQSVCSLYLTNCRICGSEALADWVQWDERSERMIRVKYYCPKCGTNRVRKPTKNDVSLAENLARSFTNRVKANRLWFPRTRIPHGDKTDSLLKQNVSHFDELFTKRNLIAISILLQTIEKIKDSRARAFLKFALSGSLKWASRQSHLRGKIVEGWAMHAYWLYPRTLEMNVWNIFERRVRSIIRGKKYHAEHIGQCRRGRTYADINVGNANYLILNRDSSSLPLPDECVDAIITDPPYGSNVNYAELSDFWYVWTGKGKTIDKKNEVVINKTQHKSLFDYENLLYRIFKECYRVLKQDRCLVCTFNSKDLRIVSSFVTAVSRAGFALHPEGLSYQRPIRAYSTTLHAMQIGSFAGDFIFTFMKAVQNWPEQLHISELQIIREHISALVTDAIATQSTEVEVRERAYGKLIPFIAKYARVDVAACREIVANFELTIHQNSHYFRDERLRITEARRKKFRKGGREQITKSGQRCEH